jgi:hypothetical protein
MATTKKNDSRSKADSKRTDAPTGAKKSAAEPREEALAQEALKLVDEAAALLRKGIRSSAATTHKTRLEAKQQAHGLLNKASTVLDDLLSQSSSTLHKVIDRL